MSEPRTVKVYREPGVRVEPEPDWPLPAQPAEPLHAHRMVPSYRVDEAVAQYKTELAAKVRGLPSGTEVPDGNRLALLDAAMVLALIEGGEESAP